MLPIDFLKLRLGLSLRRWQLLVAVSVLLHLLLVRMRDHVLALRVVLRLGV